MTTRTTPAPCRRTDSVSISCAHFERAAGLEVGKLDGVVTVDGAKVSR